MKLNKKIKKNTKKVRRELFLNKTEHDIRL
jgi:hypothetical protein